MKKHLFSLIAVTIMLLALISIFTLPVLATNVFSPSVPVRNTSAPSTPTFNSIVPNVGLQGQTVNVILSGWYMGDATSVVFSGTGVTAGALTIIDANHISCAVTIQPTATAGARNITIYYSGLSHITANNAFSVIAAPPTIASINPYSGLQGQTIDIIIRGTNFNGTVTANFNYGDITVNRITVNSNTQLTINITIANNAVPAERSITVNAFGGTVTRNPAFTVIKRSVSTGSQLPPSGSSSVSAPTQAPVALTNIIVPTASLSSTKVAPGTPVTITATAVNSSPINGSTRLVLYINGQEETSQGVKVSSGSSTPVEFTVTRNEPGTYSVYIGGTSAGSFTVDEFANPNIILYISIAFIAAAFVTTLLLLARKRQPGR